MTCSVINDSVKDMSADLIIRTKRLDGSLSGELSYKIKGKANGTPLHYGFTLKKLGCNDPSTQYITATLCNTKDSAMHARSIYFPIRLRKIKWQEPRITVQSISAQSGKSVIIKISSHSFAKSVQVSFGNLPVTTISDNFFDLEAGEKKHITVEFGSPISPGEARKSLYFRCLNDLFISS